MSAIATIKSPTNFHLILQQVKEAGLLHKRPSFYVIRLAVISVVASALWVGAGFVGSALAHSQWWIIAGFALAGLLGIMSAQYGFIAHEVSNVVPEAIIGEKDAVNEDGSINPQGIDQSKLVPLLTAALQEVITLIESQQSQIDALTARIAELETT